MSQLTQFMPPPKTYKSEDGSQSTMCQVHTTHYSRLEKPTIPLATQERLPPERHHVWHVETWFPFSFCYGVSSCQVPAKLSSAQQGTAALAQQSIAMQCRAVPCPAVRCGTVRRSAVMCRAVCCVLRAVLYLLFRTSYIKHEHVL